MNYYEMEIERRLNDKMRCMLDRLDEAFNHLLTDLGEVDKETLSNIRSCLAEFENIKTEVKNTTELSEERVRTLLNSSEEALKAQFATLKREFAEVLESRFPTGYAEGVVNKIVPEAVATFMEEENGNVLTVDDIVHTLGDSEDNVISQKAVTMEIEGLRVNFENQNCYNPDFTKSGFYIDTIGELKARETCYYSTDFIPIENGKTYSWTELYGLLICTYDENYNFIERLTPYITPAYSSKVFDESVAFVRLGTYDVEFPENFMFVKGELPVEYIPHTSMLRGEKIPDKSIDEKKVADRAITERKTIFFDSLNKFDRKNLKVGYITSEGAINANAESTHTNYFIPVRHDTMYSWTYEYGVCICTYDENYNFIERLLPYAPTDGSEEYRKIVFNSNVAFVRLTAIQKEFPEHYMFVEGELPEEYIPFSNKIKEKYLTGTIDELFLRKNVFDISPKANDYYLSGEGALTFNSTHPTETMLSYIPIENGETYTWTYLYGLLICTYDENYNFIERLTPYTTPSYTSTVFNDNVAFIRLSTYNTTFPNDFMFVKGKLAFAGGEKINPKYLPVLTGDMKVAWFGDSISQLKLLPHRVGELLQIEVNDCSFAGGVMCCHANENYRNLGFAELVNAIIEQDFTTQETAISNIETANGTTETQKRENLATLQSLDFSEINTVVVLYGTNDWGNNNNTLETFKERMTNAISSFLTAFPHIQMYFISPIWRGNGEETLSGMGTLYDVVSAEKEVCKTFNIPFYDLYKNGGINAQTKGYYLNADELHQTVEGDKMLANKCAKFISSN